MSYKPPHLRVSQDNKAKPSPAISEQTTTTMPYIPPHLRLLNSQASSSSSSSSSDVIHHHPHLRFGASSDVIYRFIVVLHHEHMSFQHVKFVRFKGHIYTHLLHFQLYTLTPDLDPAQHNSTEVNEPVPRNPVNVILQSLKEDLKQVLEKLGRFAHAESHGRMVPSILLRFGRTVFHDRRGYFDWGGSYTPENLEWNVKTRRLSKTFNDCLSRDDYVFLHKLAHKDALHIQSEEAILIQVEDEMRPGSDLMFTCSLSEHNEESVNPGKRDVHLSEITDSAKHALELEEVTLPYRIRHMIGDVACVGKSRDIRLAFLMEETPPGLTEMELCDLKSSFNKASIDGLHWPQHSTSGRFKVVKSSHWISTIVIGGGLKWHLESVGVSSYFVSVKPIICEDFCKGRKEWNTEMAILSIEELLQRVWADCM